MRYELSPNYVPSVPFASKSRGHVAQLLWECRPCTHADFVEGVNYFCSFYTPRFSFSLFVTSLFSFSVAWQTKLAISQLLVAAQDFYMHAAGMWSRSRRLGLGYLRLVSKTLFSTKLCKPY